MGYSLNTYGKIKVIDLSDNTQVNATATNDQILTPNAGYLYRIRNIFYNAPDPSGSSSGTHQLDISQYDGAAYKDFLQTKANTGTTCTIQYTSLRSSTNLPTDAAAQAKIITDGIIASNSYPVRFRYTNSTDVNQTGTRYLYVFVEETAERS